MHQKPERPRERIAFLEAKLREAEAQIGILLAQLRALNLEGIQIAPWMADLRAQEIALIAALRAAYPRVLDIYALDEAMPRQDRAADRSIKCVHVAIHGARKKLGFDAITTVRGHGWRLSDEFAARMNSLPTDLNS